MKYLLQRVDCSRIMQAVVLIAVLIVSQRVAGQSTLQSDGDLIGNVQIGDGNVLRGRGTLQGNVQISGGEVASEHHGYKVGDEVVVLRETAMNVGERAVGTLQIGDRRVIERIQGKWLRVSSGNTTGWIDNVAVIDANLLARYEAKREGSTEQLGGTVRTKINGVTFDVRTGGQRTAIATEQDMMRIQGNRLTTVIHKSGDLACDLSVSGRSCGSVQHGDHVLIDAARGVFVNGRLQLKLEMTMPTGKRNGQESDGGQVQDWNARLQSQEMGWPEKHREQMKRHLQELNEQLKRQDAERTKKHDEQMKNHLEQMKKQMEKLNQELRKGGA